MDDNESIASRVTIEARTRSTESPTLLLLTSGLLEMKTQLTDIRKSVLRLDTDIGNLLSYLQDLEVKLVDAGVLKAVTASER